MIRKNSQSRMSLKLLIDTKSQTVLYAEAGKDFVDFLFSLMSLPVGAVVSLLSSSGMVGSIGKVYQSIDKLGNAFIQPNVDKATLLCPKIAADHNNWGIVPLLLPNTDEILPEGKKMYTCPRLTNSYRTYDHHCFVARDSTATCPHCSTKMSLDVKIVEASNKKGVQDRSSSSSEGGGGFVKGLVTYMVTDHLEVRPMSAISGIAMLNKYNVKEVGALEERRVSIGMDEGLKLLKASLQSKTVLTNVFLEIRNDDVPPPMFCIEITSIIKLLCFLLTKRKLLVLSSEW